MVDKSVCQPCQYKVDCAKYSSKCHLQTPILEAVWNFRPATLIEVKIDHKKELRLIYEECYRVIFGRDNKSDNLYRLKSAYERISENISLCRTTPRLYFLTLMWCHREAERNKFYCNYVLGEGAVTKFTRWKLEAQNKFGNHDEGSLEELSEKSGQVKSYHRQLTDSMTMVGEWVVRHRLKCSGPTEKIFLEMNEWNMPMIWLVLSQEYYDNVLVPWHEKRIDSTDEQDKLRTAVARNLAKLKRKKNMSAWLFDLKAQCMKESLVTVFAKFKHRPEDFSSANAEWTSEFKFWGHVGNAMVHWKLLNFYHYGTSLDI